MKKTVLNIVIAVLFCIANVGKAFADAPNPGDIPTPYGGDDEPAGSIDGAVLWLITAGILLAYYFVLRQKRVVRNE